MSRNWITGMPDPPEGKMWCIACVLFAKGEIDTDLEEQFEASNKDGKKDHDQWFAAKSSYPLQVAVVQGPCAELMQLGILNLCWTHVAGVKIKPVSGLVPAAPIPPGLLRGAK